MARYTISYTCGHSGEVNLIGPHRYRESRIAYLENGECFECYKQHSTQAAQEQAEALELPALVGSEKQIAWAEKLRIVKLNEIEAAVERYEDDKKYRQILMAVEHIGNETSAKQWIEWRYDSPEYIITRVLKALLAAPTEEQKRAQQEAQTQAEAIKRAALVEATIRPESSVSETAAEITISDKTISVVFPEIREDFNGLVRSLGYTWSNGCWQRTIGSFAGTVGDRAVELGHILLSRGFLVRAFDDDLRSRIVAGVYMPEQTRWITRRMGGKYTNWFAIQWGQHEDYYQAARKIENSRYSRPNVVAPPAQFAQVLDFAQRYDFHLSNGAQEVVKSAREDQERMIVVKKEPVSSREKMPPVGEKPPVLVVPDSVAIADELRD